MVKHTFNKFVLKQYDIRGIVGEAINEIDAYYVGKSYGTLLRQMHKSTCVLGYDARETSEPYASKVTEGLLECGINVTNIGLAPTPMVYFALQFLGKSAALIVTASHNPPEYNGFKMLTNRRPIWGEDIQKLGKIASSGEFIDGGGSRVEFRDIKNEYFDFLLQRLDKNLGKTFKICWDAGNGAVAAILKDFVKKLPGEHLTICDTIDPAFPNHHPNPEMLENMKMLSETVVKNNCDFGIAFDGDGDRIGVVDGEGVMLYGDQLLCIFARDFLSKHPGEAVMSEVSSSQVLYDDIKKHGGVPVMWKPGHSIQKAKMASDHIMLAGETSGHIFFGENHNYDDALYAAIKLINILASSPKSLTAMRKEFPKTYATNKITVKSDDVRKMEIPQEIAKRLEKDKTREVSRVEGVRVKKADGWWMCRHSSTSPNMTVRCEALSEKGLEECRKELWEQLLLSGCKIELDELL